MDSKQKDLPELSNVMLDEEEKERLKRFFSGEITLEQMLAHAEERFGNKSENG